MTEAMSMVQFVSKVLRVCIKTENNDCASASVCPLVAPALDKMHLSHCPLMRLSSLSGQFGRNYGLK